MLGLSHRSHYVMLGLSHHSHHVYLGGTIHIHYESPIDCLMAFGNHPETIDVNLHTTWVGLDNPTMGQFLG